MKGDGLFTDAKGLLEKKPPSINPKARAYEKTSLTKMPIKYAKIIRGINRYSKNIMIKKE
jgi:hypothetical protein